MSKIIKQKIHIGLRPKGQKEKDEQSLTFYFKHTLN